MSATGPSPHPSAPGLSRRRFPHWRSWCVALLALLGGAAYLWTAPVREERTLQTATLTQLQSLAAQQPGNPRVFYHLGVRDQQVGDGPAAQAAFGRSAALAPDDERTWLAWAASARAFQDAAQSYAILRTFLARHPNSAPAHLALAEYYQQNNAHGLAYREAASAAHLSPRDAAACLLAGTEALQLQNYTEGEGWMRQAVRLAPGDWRNQLGLGDALFDLNRQPEAVACLQQAVRLAPQEAEAFYSLGRAQLRGGGTPRELQAAQANLERAVSLSPQRGAAFLALGQCYDLQSRWPQALAALQQAARLTPDDSYVHYALARALRRTGRGAEADREDALHLRLQTYMQEKQRLGDLAAATGSPQTRLALARLYAAHGDFAAAMRVYRAVLKASPRLDVARQALAALEADHRPSP